MADAILYGVAQSIIVRSGSFINQQIRLIRGVKAELQKMNHTVSTILAVLHDAEEQQVENHQAKDWLLKLTDAVFDADDLLSEFSTHALRQRVMDSDKMPKKVRIFFSSSNQLVFGFNMNRKIKAMRERLDDIAHDGNNFQLKLVDSPLETWAVTRGSDQTHSFVREKEVIGREEDKKAIIDLLLDFDMEENVSFISIVGMGGLGKTTLVPYVYNDEEVTAYFELKMWVCVSDVFDEKAIVEKIIASATNKKPQNLEMDQLQNELRKNLNQKKYLLVMDDVWNEDEERWCNLRTLLLDGLKGSKVLITTRTKLVANITSTVSPYVLEGLSNNQSWSLFTQMTLGKKQEIDNPNLEAIGRDIVEKCCGVPLAIKTIGRVLHSKKTEPEWLYIKNNELTNVTKLRDGIILVLRLSYNHLPSHLKCCFAYCSLFPKNYLIDKFTLIQLWIAQGFIQSSEENLQLEDVANEYFMDLHWRSFFEEAIEDQGRNMYFKMHDLIHDLAQSISRIECTLVDSNAKNVNEKVRHLSFPFYHSSFFKENLTLLVKANKIRTFILTSNPYLTSIAEASYRQSVDDIASSVLVYIASTVGSVEESTLKTLILTFKYLRVFDLHSLQMVTVPKFVGKMMHLRYLDLSYNYIEFLPRSITRLVNLQTLKLIHCQKLRELPKDIQKLVKLKHLHINGCENLTHVPCGLGQLTGLQTLSLFVVRKDLVGSSKHHGELDELNKLNELRGKLEIKNLAWVIDATSKSKVANLKEKQHLSELELVWNANDNVGIEAQQDDESLLDGLQPHQSLKFLRVEGYRGVRFSSWLSSLTNLVKLNVENCKKCQYLQPLCQLPSLEELLVRHMDGLECISDQDITYENLASMGSSGTTFFPSLYVLILEYCPNLKKWWRRDIADNGDVASTSTSTSSSHQYQQQISLPYFPRLLLLHIRDCNKLSCMPLFPTLYQLVLRNASWKPSQQTMAMTMNTVEASLLPSSSSSSSSPLSGLHCLTLENIQDIESVPEEWPQNLISLERLDIWECPRLTSLSRFMQYLPSLKSLTIERCELVDQFSNDTECHLPIAACLQTLVFTGISKLESLPAYLQHVTTLQKLEVSECHSFLTLPEWIGNLTSLRKIVIESCPNLTSLPEGMRHLTSLQMLRIFNCPQLEQRCEEENGEDWYKIAHVPFYSNAALDMDDLLGNF
ncbi:putative disease resistance protein RGA4 [Castanea sativa]|uniref:putative disease resistance protein RGA4 n=1 Tax=Castanea sativa TaxID=21020 RepID=UPI003F64E6C1